MKQKLKIPRGGCVFVGDGRKALVLRNQGDEVHANLQLDRMIEASDNPPTHLQGTDRPGRAMMGDRRSAVDQTDWHDLAETRFAKEALLVLEDICRHHPTPAIVIVAPPRTLANLRSAMPPALQGLVIAEIDKELTNLSVYEIERHLTQG